MTHHLPCPLCQSQIPIDLRLLAQGASFQCPNASCRATIGVDRSNLGTFAGALKKYENMDALRTNKKSMPQR